VQPLLYDVAVVGDGEGPSPDYGTHAERLVHTRHADAKLAADKEDDDKFHDRFRATGIWASELGAMYVVEVDTSSWLCF
jgi:hypothetical protein